MKQLFFATILFSFLALAVPTVSAQSFEGVIDFRKTNSAGKVYYSYTVKGNKVRIDEKSEDGKTITATLLIDIASKQVFALSHERNMYMTREAKPTERVAGSPKVIRSGNHRFISGNDCEQWRVKNESDNTEISFWVAKGHYDFFIPLMGVLGRKDRFATYYIAIPDKEGFFPIDAVERDVQRNERGRLEVMKITENKVDDSVFNIPKNFIQVEN